MAIWLVRAGRNGEREDFALENGVAVIGWGELPDLSGTKSRDDVKALLQRVYPQVGKGKLNNNGGQVWAFRQRIEKGDLVVLPLKTRGTIAVGKVTGDYEYFPDNPVDAKHTRKVEWLRDDIPRASFTKKLLHSLGAFMTVCKIQRDNAEAQILASLKGKASPPAENVEAEEIDDTTAPVDLESQAKDSIYQHITENFSGHRLADIVQAILVAQGFECHKSEPGPDGGVDILAGHGKMGFERPRLCVQVKSSQSPIDVKVLRELVGTMKNFSADSGLLVAWGGFKKSVTSEARRSFFEVRLWTAERLIEAIQTHYANFPDNLRAELPLKRVWTVAEQEDD